MKKLIALLCCTLLLNGCSWFKDDDEVDLGPADLVKFKSEAKLKKVWSVGTGAGQDEYSPTLVAALGNGAVYAADHKGRVTAVDASNGKRRWKVDIDEPISGGVGIAGDLVTVGTLDGSVIALAAADGSERWRVTLDAEVLAAPNGDSSTVAVQTLNGKLYGLNASDGSQRWIHEIDMPILTTRGVSSPQIMSNSVLAAFANGKLYVLNIDSGSVVWEARIAVPTGRTELERMVDIDGQPLVDGDIVYAASYQGSIAALSRGTGNALWYQEASSYKSPGAGLGQVYLSEANDHLRAIRGSSGTEIWVNEQLFMRQLTGPVTLGTRVLVADYEGYLHAMDYSDGHFVARTRVDGSGVVAPLLVDGDKVIVFANDGTLAAYTIQ